MEGGDVVNPGAQDRPKLLRVLRGNYDRIGLFGGLGQGKKHLVRCGTINLV